MLSSSSLFSVTCSVFLRMAYFVLSLSGVASESQDFSELPNKRQKLSSSISKNATESPVSITCCIKYKLCTLRKIV
jgi:hypothetical protein